MNPFIKLFAFYLGLSLIPLINFGQSINEPKPLNDNWTKSYEPFRVAGNLYYVGTYDLACYLITTQQGHILINTGIASSASVIENNLTALGFDFSDIKILLITQAHWDHTGALAAIKAKTKAQMMANEKDAPVLEDGGSSDYALGGNGSTFEPVKVDRQLLPNDIVELGEMKIKMLHHPGHTKGSCSYLFTVKDDQHSYEVLIANMPSIIVDKKLSEVSTYPSISDDLAFTHKAMRDISFDIWLSSHASQFNLHKKRKPGDVYNPQVFFDRAGYDAALISLQKQFESKK